MGYGNWGGLAYRNGIFMPSRSDAAVYEDGLVTSLWDKTPSRPLRDEDPSIGGHIVLGDGPLYCVLYKHYLEIADPSGVRYRSLTDPAWGWEYDVQSSVLRVDEHLVEHVIGIDRATGDMCAVLHVQQPDGMHWHGFCGLSMGAGFTRPDDVRRTKRAIRTMRRTFKAQWGFWGPC